VSKKIKQIKSSDDNVLLYEYIETQNLDVLGELYNRYIHLVYGVCLKYFKDREKSQDAVSAIFEKLITDIGNTKIENFKSWLYVVTKNFCLMELRKDQSQRKRHEQFSADSFMESTQTLHPIDEERNEDVETQLKKCIEKLKSEQKSCIELFYYQDKCYKEIATELKIEEKKVKSFIQNGKRNLKICLESNSENNE
jgi:RNA polymerase sigma-70 factor (ECF subfamily)